MIQNQQFKLNQVKHEVAVDLDFVSFDNKITDSLNKEASVCVWNTVFFCVTVNSLWLWSQMCRFMFRQMQMKIFLESCV